MDAINLFNQWVKLGKDEGMEINHKKSVNLMLDLIPSRIFNSNFDFIDIGCGNGWLVQKLANMPNCNLAVGVDGSKEMIQKAVSKDPRSQYIKLDLNDIDKLNEEFDVVFSMEVIYYLNNPLDLVSYIFSNLLRDKGCLILGLDHYLENHPSLSWSKDLNVPLCTYSISDWKQIILDAGFSDVSVYQFGAKDQWKGTLVLYAEK